MDILKLKSQIERLEIIEHKKLLAILSKDNNSESNNETKVLKTKTEGYEDLL